MYKNPPFVSDIKLCIKNCGNYIKSDALTWPVITLSFHSRKVFFDWISEEGVIDFLGFIWIFMIIAVKRKIKKSKPIQRGVASSFLALDILQRQEWQFHYVCSTWSQTNSSKTIGLEIGWPIKNDRATRCAYVKPN